MNSAEELEITTAEPTFLAIPSRTLRQIFLFGSFGILGTTFDFGIYLLLIHLGVSTAIAKCPGFIIGIAANYFFSSRFTYEMKTHHPETITKFFLFYSFGLVFNVSLNEFFIHLINSPHQNQIAFVITTAFSATLHFFGQKFFIFRKF